MRPASRYLACTPARRRRVARSGKAPAFTLLELIVVIVILAILALLAIPTFTGVIRKSKDATAEATLSALGRDVAALAALNGGTITTSDVKTAVSELPSAAAAPGRFASGTAYTLTSGTSSAPGQIAYAISSGGTSAGLAEVVASGDVVYSRIQRSSVQTWVGCSAATGAEALGGPSGTSACSSSGGSSSAQGSGGATVIGSTTTTPPATPAGLSAVPGGTTVTLSWNTVSGATGYVVDRNGTKVASTSSTSYTDTGLTAATTYAYTVAAVNAAGTSAASVTVYAAPSPYASTVSSDGASIYYQMDEPSGTLATDASGNGNVGYIGGGPAYGQAPPTTQMGGASLAISSPDVSVHQNTAGPTTLPARFAMQVWFKTTSTNGGYLTGWMSTKVNSSSTTAWDPAVYLDAAGAICFEAYNSGQAYVCTSGTYNNGAWHDVVAEATASGMAIYVDGSLVASNSTVNTESYAGYFHVAGGMLCSSSNQGCLPNADYWNLVGSVSNAAFYPTALSASQISGLQSAATK